MKRLIVAAFLLALTTMASAATFYTADSAHTVVPTSSSVTKNGANWAPGNVAFSTASTIAGKYATVTMSNVTTSGSYCIVANYAGTKETYQEDYDSRMNHLDADVSTAGARDQEAFAIISSIKVKTDKMPDYYAP